MIIFRRVRYAIACHMERYFEQNDVIMYENSTPKNKIRTTDYHKK